MIRTDLNLLSLTKKRCLIKLFIRENILSRQAELTLTFKTVLKTEKTLLPEVEIE